MVDESIEYQNEESKKLSISELSASEHYNGKRPQSSGTYAFTHKGQREKQVYQSHAAPLNSVGDYDSDPDSGINDDDEEEQYYDDDERESPEEMSSHSQYSKSQL